MMIQQRNQEETIMVCDHSGSFAGKITKRRGKHQFSGVVDFVTKVTLIHQLFPWLLLPPPK